MAIVAIAVGIFVFLLTGAMTSELTHDTGAGIVPGIILGIMAAARLFKLAAQERSNFLLPAPHEYNIPAKIAFAKIRDILAETTYNYGDKWHVVTADKQSGRITAHLRFTDEFNRIEGDARGNIRTHKERLQRLLALDVQVRKTERGTTVVQLDFTPVIEGVNYMACDSIRNSTCARIAQALGSGTH